MRVYSIHKVFPIYADQLSWEHNLKRNFIWNFVRNSLLQRYRQVLNVIWNTVEPTGLKLTLFRTTRHTITDNMFSIKRSTAELTKYNGIFEI